ncbi:MAG: SDR family oxidoreductase [Bryobacteraceae bacterium]|nr:SDR family oxidoreductase [Bryobacteraceae bacterium]
MRNEFTGRTALVTGASRGIGAATAVALARAGCARLLLHYASSPEAAGQTAARVREAGASAELLAGDLSTEAGIRAFVEALGERARAVDILVNNAGSLLQRARLAEMSYQLYNRVMDLNAKSVWFITQAVAPHMVQRGSGVIVHVSSIAARNGGGLGATVYAAAKAAVSAFARGMARELAPHGVRVNAVSPGTVDNDFHARFSTREMLDAVLRQTPQGRLSTNEDIAGVIVFLCSDAARNIIGQTIEVNGGAFMI